MVSNLRLLIFIIVLFIASSAHANSIPVIDLSERDISEPIHLDGEWAFYWGVFLSPGQPEDLKYQVVEIPSRWTKYDNLNMEGQSYPAFGYGTYRVKVILPHQSSSGLTVKTRRVKMSHRFYVNGELIGQLGNPSSNPEDYVGVHQPLEMDLALPEGDAELDIVVHVANYQYARGGMDVSPLIGLKDSIDRKARISIFNSALVAGALLTMALYHFGLWVKRKKDLSTIVFGVFCLFISIRMLVTGEMYILYVFPGLTSVAALKTDIMTVFVAMPFMHFFVMQLFPRQASNMMFKITLGGLVIWCLALLPSIYWTSFVLPFFEAHVFIILLHTLWIGVKALIAREQGSILFIAGFVCVFITGVNDILFERGIINTTYLIHLGVLLFVFAQSALLSTRFSQAFTDLENLKESLEAQVARRTLEYQNARDEALTLSQENRLLSHRITSVLESERKAIAQEIHDNFNASIAAVKFMIDNLKRSEGRWQANSFGASIETISNILNEIYSGARQLVRRLRPEVIDTLGLSGALKELLDSYRKAPSKLSIDYTIDSKSDDLDEETRIAIYRICQEAITNVLKHSRADHVVVTVVPVGDGLVFTVDDNGVGINISNTPGIGLISMRERALGVGAELNVENLPEGGTRVSFQKASAWG